MLGQEGLDALESSLLKAPSPLAHVDVRVV